MSSPVKIDDRDLSFSYDARWEQTGNPLEFQRTTTSTDQNGATATVRFTGTRIVIFGTVPNYSNPRSSYRIDGRIAQTYVASPGRTVQYNVAFFDSGVLSPGSHTLTITNLEGYIYLDAADVYLSPSDNASQPSASQLAESASNSSPSTTVTEGPSNSQSSVPQGLPPVPSPAAPSSPSLPSTSEPSSGPRSQRLEDSSPTLATVTVTRSEGTLSTFLRPTGTSTFGAAASADILPGTSSASRNSVSPVSVGALVGAILGGLALACFTLILVIILRRRRLHQRRRGSVDMVRPYQGPNAVSSSPRGPLTYQNPFASQVSVLSVPRPPPAPSVAASGHSSDESRWNYVHDQPAASTENGEMTVDGHVETASKDVTPEKLGLISEQRLAGSSSPSQSSSTAGDSVTQHSARDPRPVPPTARNAMLPLELNLELPRPLQVSVLPRYSDPPAYHR